MLVDRATLLDRIVLNDKISDIMTGLWVKYLCEFPQLLGSVPILPIPQLIRTT